MGLLGVTVPEELGGLGLGYLEHTIAMEGKSGQETIHHTSY
jgi:alkylation response protein AidB-like acyl-CoA dehydrogenase